MRAGAISARVCNTESATMSKHSKRRQRLEAASFESGNARSVENALAFRMEGLEARQMLNATIDLRTPTGGKAVTVSSVGQVVSLDVWAVITAGDTDAANDAFQWAHGSFLSSDVGGGAASGTLAATLSDPFAAGNGASNGAQTDLDGDGDLDVGSNNNV